MVNLLLFLALYVGAIIESDARLTGMQLKREAKLLTVIGLNTKYFSNEVKLKFLFSQNRWIRLYAKTCFNIPLVKS